MSNPEIVLRPSAELRPLMTRRWQAWRGNNVFLCSGKIMLGPDIGPLIGTVTIICVTFSCWLSQVGPKLSWPVVVVGVPIWLLSLWFLYLTATTEPGIIPRMPSPPLQQVQDNLMQSRGKGIYETRFCTTCNVWKPPKAKHCRFCDNCVLEFDHHCPWTSTCIGRRNYRHFVLFIYSTALLDSYAAVFAWYLIYKRGEAIVQGSFWQIVEEGIKSEIFDFIIAIWCLLLLISLLQLVAYHSYLSATDQTTNEQVRNARRSDVVLAQQSSYYENCSKVFCLPLPDSSIDFQELISSPDQSSVVRDAPNEYP